MVINPCLLQGSCVCLLFTITNKHTHTYTRSHWTAGPEKAGNNWFRFYKSQFLPLNLIKAKQASSFLTYETCVYITKLYQSATKWRASETPPVSSRLSGLSRKDKRARVKSKKKKAIFCTNSSDSPLLSWHANESAGTVYDRGKDQRNVAVAMTVQFAHWWCRLYQTLSLIKT